MSATTTTRVPVRGDAIPIGRNADHMGRFNAVAAHGVIVISEYLDTATIKDGITTVTVVNAQRKNKRAECLRSLSFCCVTRGFTLMHDLILTPTQHLLWFGNSFSEYSKRNGELALTWVPVGIQRGTLVAFMREKQPAIPRDIRKLLIANQTNLVNIRLKKESEHKRYTIFFKDLLPYIKLQTTADNEQDYLTFVAFKSYLFTKHSSVFFGGLISDISGKEFPVCNIRCHPDVVPFLQGLDMVETVMEDSLIEDASKQIKKGFLDVYCETGSEGFHWIVTEFVQRPNPYEDQVHLRDGHHLTILDDDDAIVWQGQIKYDWKIGYTPYPRNPKNGQQLALGCWVNGIQEGFAPDDWANLFFRGQSPRSQKRPYKAIVSV